MLKPALFSLLLLAPLGAVAERSPDEQAGRAQNSQGPAATPGSVAPRSNPSAGTELSSSWPGAVGGLTLTLTVFALLGAAAATRRARDRAADQGMGPTAIRLPAAFTAPGCSHAVLDQLLLERAALRTALRDAGVELAPEALDPPRAAA